MTRKSGWILLALTIIVVLGYLGYTKILFPKYVARIIIAEGDTPGYLPAKYGKRLIKSRQQINSSADSVLVIIRRKDIDLKQLLKAIDGIKEQQAYGFLDELNATKIVSSDQVFDIGKKHFRAEFDVELFREIFRKKVPVSLIKKGLALANKQREDDGMETETLRAVAKQILIEKEKKIMELK